MSDAPIIVQQRQELARPLVQEAANNARRSLSEASKRAYKSDWGRFQAWCQRFGLSPLPAPEAVIITYLTAASQGVPELGQPPLKYSSLERAYAAIRVYHEEAETPLGTLRGVRNCFQAIARKIGVAKTQKKALTREQIQTAVALLPADAYLERAILLFGWTIGQRRSNISALNLGDVEIAGEGAVVIIRKSKTDQLGEGRSIGVTRIFGPYCPVLALEEWLLVRELEGESLFGLTGPAVSEIAKDAAASLGLDPREYGGHSLRRGFVTSAARAGFDVSTIMRTTGHKSVEQVQTYIETSDPYDRNVGSSLLAGETKETMKTKLTATLGEIAGPTLTKETMSHPVTGQPLVSRRIAKAEFLRNGRPLDLAWVKKQAKAMHDKGRSARMIKIVLHKVGVRKADGSEIEEADVERWIG